MPSSFGNVNKVSATSVFISDTVEERKCFRHRILSSLSPLVAVIAAGSSLSNAKTPSFRLGSLARSSFFPVLSIRLFCLVWSGPKRRSNICPTQTSSGPLRAAFEPGFEPVSSAYVDRKPSIRFILKQFEAEGATISRQEIFPEFSAKF